MKLLLTSIGTIVALTTVFWIAPQTAHAEQFDYCSMQKPVLKYKKVAYGDKKQAWIATKVGRAVYAVADGKVESIILPRHLQPMRNRPARIVIRHDNGMKSIYSQMSSVAMWKNDRVEAGQFIGSSGGEGLGSYRSSGPHLTFNLHDATGKKLDTRCIFE